MKEGIMGSALGEKTMTYHRQVGTPTSEPQQEREERGGKRELWFLSVSISTDSMAAQLASAQVLHVAVVYIYPL